MSPAVRTNLQRAAILVAVCAFFAGLLYVAALSIRINGA